MDEGGRPTGPAVAAVVVTHNRRDVLAGALEAITAQTRPPDCTWVVDNASEDGTDAMVRQRFPRVRYLSLPENRGYGAGLRTGMSRAVVGADWLWLLDDDSSPRPTALHRILETGLAVPRCGVVGLAGGTLRWGVPVHGGRRPLIGTNVSAAACDFLLVDGSLVSAEAVAAVGLPRDDFFMMMEDVEYTSRVRRAGFELVLLDEDLISRAHLGSGGSGSVSPPWRGYYQARNHLLIARDHGSAREIVGSLARQAKFLAAALAVTDHKAERVRMRLAGVRDGLLGRTGRVAGRP